MVSESSAQNILVPVSWHYVGPSGLGKTQGCSKHSFFPPLRDARPCWTQVSSSLPSCRCAGASLLPSFLLQSFDDFIFAFFAVEMIVKMIALGIFGKKCYLGDTWNRLDFFIVIAG